MTILKLFTVLALLAVGVAAVLGLTPPVPQSVVIGAFFIVGPVCLFVWASRRQAVQR